ncbi:MAG: hypothetical protein ACE5KL_06875, partial [Alphaproteobacteria bacterium]
RSSFAAARPWVRGGVGRRGPLIRGIRPVPAPTFDLLAQKRLDLALDPGERAQRAARDTGHITE